jgi:biotin synthase-like enzyme
MSDDRALDVLGRIEEIRIARLRPGDIVLVKTPPDMKDYELVGMLATIQHWFPHHDVRICAGIDVEVIRPEEAS